MCFCLAQESPELILLFSQENLYFVARFLYFVARFLHFFQIDMLKSEAPRYEENWGNLSPIHNI